MAWWALQPEGRKPGTAKDVDELSLGTGLKNTERTILLLYTVI